MSFAIALDAVSPSGEASHDLKSQRFETREEGEEWLASWKQEPMIVFVLTTGAAIGGSFEFSVVELDENDEEVTADE